MKRLVITLFALLMAVSSLTCAMAATTLPEPTDDFWVLDQANVLTEETEGMIFFANQLLADEEVNSEVVVVTVRTTGDYTIDDYTYALFNNWEIHGEGALIVLAIGDDDYYTIPGELLSTKLSSSDLADMQDEYLETDFAAKNYDAGVKKYFTALFDRAAKLYGSSVTAADGTREYEAWLAEEDVETAPVTQTQTQSQPAPAAPQNNTPRRESGSMTGIIAIIVILIVIFIIIRSSRRNRANTYTTYNTTYYDNTPPQRSSGFNTGFLMGSLLNSRNRRPPAGPGPMPPHSSYGTPPPRSGGYSAPSRPSSSSSRSYSSGFSSSSSRSSSGFGGATRSSSSSRSSGFSSSSSRSSRSSSGFGGASRSRSSSSGSRGGGAGRGRR